MSCFTFDSSWTTARSIIIDASPDQVYATLSDVPQWPQWDDGLVSASLDVPNVIANGAEGTLVMKERGTFRFTLNDIDPADYFAYDTALKGVDAHWFWAYGTETEAGVVLEIGVTFRGWLASWYKYWLEKECNEAFERCCQNLKRIIEGRAVVMAQTSTNRHI